MDLTLWPQRLGLLAKFAGEAFPGVLDDSSPADFLGSLAVEVGLRRDVASHLGTLCNGVPVHAQEVIKILDNWAADENHVAKIHPTNQNDEQQNAAVWRHYFGDLVFKASELYALAEALKITLAVSPMGGRFGVFYYVPGCEVRGTLVLKTKQDEWTIARWTPGQEEPLAMDPPDVD